MNNNENNLIQGEKNKRWIESLINTHNQLFPEQKIEFEDRSNLQNVSNLYICCYDGDEIGLFERKTATYKPFDHFNKRYAEELYIGLYSKNRGIKTTWYDNHPTDTWQLKGTKSMVYKDTFATCSINNAKSFEFLRQTMYDNGELGVYKIGFANDEEILKVLSFARKYFNGYSTKRR